MWRGLLLLLACWSVAAHIFIGSVLPTASGARKLFSRGGRAAIVGCRACGRARRCSRRRPKVKASRVFALLRSRSTRDGRRAAAGCHVPRILHLPPAAAAPLHARGGAAVESIVGGRGVSSSMEAAAASSAPTTTPFGSSKARAGEQQQRQREQRERLPLAKGRRGDERKSQEPQPRWRWREQFIQHVVVALVDVVGGRRSLPRGAVDAPRGRRHERA